MDNRRLDTGHVLADGIINQPVPQTDIPCDREELESTDDAFSFVGAGKVVAELDNGKVVKASNYYGIPYVWKTETGYRGLLLQYRAVTEDRTFETATDAAEWFKEMYHATDG